MKPARHFTFAVGVRSGFAKAQLAFGDRLATTTTLGAPGWRRLNRIRHAHIFAVHGRSRQVFAARRRDRQRRSASASPAELNIRAAETIVSRRYGIEVTQS